MVVNVTVVVVELVEDTRCNPTVGYDSSIFYSAAVDFMSSSYLKLMGRASSQSTVYSL